MISSEAYPLFEPNQVLSYQHLNQLSEHLRGMDMLAARALIGVGPFCGLEIQYHSSIGITLGKGGGITTAGDLFVADNPFRFDHYDSYQLPTPYGPLMESKDKAFKLWQCLPTRKKPSDIGGSLRGAAGQAFLSDKVAFLYLEKERTDLDECLIDHCINQGAEWRLNWRLLLISMDDARTVLGRPARLGIQPSEAQLKATFNRCFRLPIVAFERCLIYPDDGRDYKILGRKYERLIINEIRDGVLAAITQVLQAFGPSVGLPEVARRFSRGEAISQLELALRSIQKSGGVGMQHLWDHLRHLHVAYEEAVNLAFQWISRCLIDTQAFPKHLFLGHLAKDTACEPSVYRHAYHPSPATHEAGEDKAQLRLALERLHIQVSKFLIPEVKSTRITPSGTLAEPLDKRAIPFYYSAGALLKSWSFEATSQCRSGHLKTFHREALAKAPWNEDPLRFSIDKHDFLRIEGHHGKRTKEVEAEIERLRVQYNLPFQVVSLRFGEGDTSQHNDCCCSLEDLRRLYSLTRTELLCHFTKLSKTLTVLSVSIAREARQREENKEEFEETLEKVVIVDEKSREGDRMRVDYGMIPDFFMKEKGTEKNKHHVSVDGTSLEELEHLETGENLPNAESFEGTDPLRRAWEKNREKAGYYAYEDMTSGFRKTEDPESKVEYTYPIVSERMYPHLDTEDLGNQLLKEVLGRLSETSSLLGPELVGFDFKSFELSHRTLIQKSRDLYELTLYVMCHKEECDTRIIFLAQSLAIFITSCIKTRLTRIVEDREVALKQMQERDTLPYFMRNHPALEHGSGVPKGGTFVMVSGRIPEKWELYESVPEKEDREKGDREKFEELLAKLFPEQAKEIKGHLGGHRVPKATKHSEPKPGIATVEVMMDAIENAEQVEKIYHHISAGEAKASNLDEDALAKWATRAIEEMEKQRADEVEQEQVVLADFFLPYLCCSDCASLEYIVMPEVSLSLPKECFEANDPIDYPFTGLPAGGTMPKISGVFERNGIWYFNPSQAQLPEGDIVFTYVYGGRQAQYKACIKFPEPPPSPEPKLIIESEVDVFCSSDTTPYLLKGTPILGVYSGDGKVDLPKGAHFVPAEVSEAAVEAGEAVLHYILDSGESATLRAPIAKAPTLNIEASTPEMTETGYRVTLVAKSQPEAEKLRWELSNGFTTDQASFTITLKPDQTISVSLFATLGPCIEVSDIKLVIPPFKEPEPEEPLLEISLDTDQKEFCALDSRTYLLNSNILNTIFFGNGYKLLPAGPAFVPALASKSLSGESEAVLHAKSPEGQTAELRYGLVTPPKIAIETKTFELIDNYYRVSLSATSDTAFDELALRWTLTPSNNSLPMTRKGDQISIEFPTKPGEGYQVLVELMAIKPPCEVSTVIKLSIPGLKEIEEEPEPFIITPEPEPTPIPEPEPEPEPTEEIPTLIAPGVDTESHKIPGTEISFQPERWDILSTDIRFAELVGSTGTNTYKSFNAFNKFILNVAEGGPEYEAVQNGAADETIFTLFTTAASSIFKKIKTLAGSALAPKDAAFLWSIDQTALLMGLQLLQLRSEDIEQSGPLSQSLQQYGKSLGELKATGFGPNIAPDPNLMALSKKLSSSPSKPTLAKQLTQIINIMVA